MMSTRKSLEELDVLSNFMLNAIANDPDVSKPFFKKLLSILLEREIGEVTVHAQTFLPADSPEHRGIFMDVEITEENNSPANCSIYSLEGQRYYEEYLQKRSRFYQAKKDSKGLKSGERDWNNLPDLYMIIITNYDPFGEDSMVYVFKNVCEQFPELPYNDGLKFIYFNTKGKKNAEKSIKELLDYLNCSKIENVKNNDIKQLHHYVSDVKQRAEVRGHYMTWGEWIDHELEETLAVERENLAVERENLTTEYLTNLRSLLLNILSKFGSINETIKNTLEAASSEDLFKWIPIAAQAATMEDFIKQIAS